MRPVVRAAEITIHKSDKIVACGDPGISLWNQPNFTGGTMSEIPYRMGMKNPILTQDIHPAMSFIANICHPQIGQLPGSKSFAVQKVDFETVPCEQLDLGLNQQSQRVGSKASD